MKANIEDGIDNDIEEKLLKIPILKYLVIIPKRIKLPGLGGLTLFDLLKTYLFGIIEGTFSSRAGSIAFSFLWHYFLFYFFY